MKKAIAVGVMAAVVVIAGITGASSAAHAAVFFTPAGTLVMSSFVPLICASFTTCSVLPFSALHTRWYAVAYKYGAPLLEFPILYQIRRKKKPSASEHLPFSVISEE